MEDRVMHFEGNRVMIVGGTVVGRLDRGCLAEDTGSRSEDMEKDLGGSFVGDIAVEGMGTAPRRRRGKVVVVDTADTYCQASYLEPE